MSAWQCESCLAVSAGGESCRACGHPRGVAGPAPEPLPRAILSRPRPDFPYSHAHRVANANRSLLAPAVLATVAVLLAGGIEPVKTELAFAHVPSSSPEDRTSRRQADLQRAATDLSALAAELRPALELAGGRLSRTWATRLDSVRRRDALGVDTARSPFADHEVALRAAMLELASLHRRYLDGDLAADALPRLAATERELARVTEDLAHAR